MLELKDISKQYKTGELTQNALQDISISFRDNEFVSILGPSGSGKTTLLNIIGGLDRYDSGELIINGVTTKKYKDRDWDAYRNHTIGFVFQSYNLIPQQSVLSNVELALTIGGLSGSERRKRAKKALEEVGLGDQLHKKPNQMSGGQMQRVAIARALVNNPAVLLADEPTGALDTETSIQVMELLKQVAKDRLVVMVTHNPELAEQYSTRIIKLRDGKITDDSDPYEAKGTVPDKAKSKRKASMNFFTSLSLSFHNLTTKKGRTFLTAFAGSIGIIGIALILALSNGVNGYISSLQEDTMASYPVTISSRTVDIESAMSSRNGAMRGRLSLAESTEARTGIYADISDTESTGSVGITENDLTGFKNYLEDPDSEIQQYIGKNGVVYTYNISFDAYSYDTDENLIRSDYDPEDSGSQPGTFGMMGGLSALLSGASGSTETAENFSEMMSGGGNIVSTVITDSYELVSGEWPENYDEVVLVLDEKNSLPLLSLYQLGLITEETYTGAKNGETELRLEYGDAIGHLFYLIPSCDYYLENEDGAFTYVGDDSMQTEALMDNAVVLNVTGVIRPAEDAANADISTAIAYTSLLTEYIIDYTNESSVVKAQEASPEINVLTGLKFEAASDDEKIGEAIAYLLDMNISNKATMYQMIQYLTPSQEDGTNTGTDAEQAADNTGRQGSPGAGMVMDETAMAGMLDAYLADDPDEGILLDVYDQYIAGNTYEDNMASFGKVSYDAPDSISIYTDSFEDKDAIADCIEAYNASVSEDAQISYTDYVALMTSSLTSIVNVISYVLIAFVAVSLIVSCIMIGIITHISVLERTKEIGILRALGASKSNISQVFNAETIIVGLLAGLLGAGVSALLTIPANAVIGSLLGAATLSVSLPITSAALLVLLSMVITVIGGLLPAKSAAKKDPVVALRTE